MMFMLPEPSRQVSCTLRPASSAPAAVVQDIFSAGCVIAELFLDGRALFDLSQVPPSPI